jgi:hypothetical protein
VSAQRRIALLRHFAHPPARSSAGAALTPEVAVQIKQLGLRLPGALGLFSGGGDFTQTGDSQQIYGVQGLSGHPDTRPKGVQWLAVYVGSADPKDPVLFKILGSERQSHAGSGIAEPGGFQIMHSMQRSMGDERWAGEPTD